MTFHEYAIICSQLILLILFIIFELFVKRFNKLVCQMYFERWEKTRVIWLYNDRLKKRVRFLKFAKKKIITKKANMTFEIENKDEKLFKFLIPYKEKLVDIFSDSFEKFFSDYDFEYPKKCWNYINKRFLNKKYCILCNFKERSKSEYCEVCKITYCSDCWVDLDRKCVGCDNSTYCFNDEFDHDQ